VKVKLSSIFHPQTDGQIERVNQVLEHYLRCTINYHQDNWSKLLAMAKFDYNNTVHSSTQQTLFFANHGLNPKFNIQDVHKVITTTKGVPICQVISLDFE
jgi:hypothetical protein